MRLKKSDITFRMATCTGEAIVSNTNESICNTIQRLFHMVPGTDEYDKEIGLNIKARAYQTHTTGSRDSEYEAMVASQLMKYTDIIPMNILAIYNDDSLKVYIEGMVDEQRYRIEVSSNNDSVLATQIAPKVI